LKSRGSPHETVGAVTPGAHPAIFFLEFDPTGMLASGIKPSCIYGVFFIY